MSAAQQSNMPNYDTYPLAEPNAIAYTLDWEITPRHIVLWMEASRCEFIGDGDESSPRDAHEQLLHIKETGIYAKRKRLGILSIYYKSKLVGFSLPRTLESSEYVKYGIDPSMEYFRMGTIFVTSRCRGRGIATTVTHQFMCAHPNIVWEHKETNINSQRVAVALGMTKRSKIWYDQKNSWYLTPIDSPRKVSLGWATNIAPELISLNSAPLLHNLQITPT